jgi:polysaccharide export outer membrane protein
MVRLQRWLIGVLLCTISVSGCITNRKYVLLQQGDVSAKGLPVDSVVRQHQQVPFEYHIQPEDLLSIQFESLTQKDFDFLRRDQPGAVNLMQGGGLLIGELVDSKGEIDIPFLGKVKAAGLSLYELQAELQRRAAGYLESPVAKVRLLNFRFTVLGEVAREGTIVVTNNRVSLLEGLGLAGGLGEFADRSKIKLIRSVNGKTDVIYLDLLAENFLSSPYYYLYPTDIIVVAALPQRPFRKYFSQNLALAVSSVTLLLLAVTVIQNANR